MSQGTFIGKAREKAREIKRNIFVLFLAYKDPRVPWYAKLFTLCVVSYAFSPIDLIPDFIPVLGYLDDLILVPLGITLAIKMIPKEVMEDCYEKAEEIRKKGKPKNWIAGALFIGIWVLVVIWAFKVCYRLFQ
ncbi:hypothetical protein J31TS4_11590 [Paenibacillus sp. J31TS4]|uniref:YkvA family protein n=1 Tax=Paenibacillus sp. J31TS4 TaxID=2807195 RepID=UPI001B2AAC13|nr:YkvA family protein [Paenibacillus sp. J31TS4]GIP37879.1 hypothetical protein J31TS4_11590 [Paenibacillus sp. J31TS4]